MCPDLLILGILLLQTDRFSCLNALSGSGFFRDFSKFSSQCVLRNIYPWFLPLYMHRYVVKSVIDKIGA